MTAGTAAASAGRRRRAGRSLAFLGRAGLAGRTAFYLILTGITVRIAVLGGANGPQADAHGALTLVSRPILGRLAIGVVALGFVLFGVGRLVGAWRDRSVSTARRALTVVQGLFYVALAYVPVAFLAGDAVAGTEQQQEKDTARLLGMPGGRWAAAAAGVILILVCAQQIRGAWQGNFRDGLDLQEAPSWVRRSVDAAGTVGITARALVFLPVGVFLIVAAISADPKRSVGTDGELLALSTHAWGVAVLAVVAAGLAVFVFYSGIETRYRDVVSAR